ncbi:MAG: O-antigen ligase family protein [bacterium]|nr:O-antigen ligase family protein [bacterium]
MSGCLIGLAFFIPFSISGADISIMLGFLVAGLVAFSDRAARERYRSMLNDPMLWPAVLLTLSALPSALLSNNLDRAMSDWRAHWQLLIYFLVAYNLIGNRLQNILFWTLFTSTALACSVSVTQSMGGIDLGVIHIAGRFRPGGTLYTMTFAGILYQIICVVSGVAMKETRVNRMLLVLVGGIALFTTALVITQTRGAALALLAGLITIILIVRRRVVFFLAGGVTVLVVVITLVTPTLRDRAAHTLTYRPGTTGGDHSVQAIGTRFALWDTAWQLFLAHPILGVGMGDYTEEADRILEGRSVQTTVDAHNIYLQVLATRGLVGFIPFVIFWIALIKMLFRIRRCLAPRKTFERYFTSGAIAATVAVLVGALTENNIDDSEVFIAFMFLIGFARSFAVGDLCDRKSSESPPPQTSP